MLENLVVVGGLNSQVSMANWCETRGRGRRCGAGSVVPECKFVSLLIVARMSRVVDELESISRRLIESTGLWWASIG